MNDEKGRSSSPEVGRSSEPPPVPDEDGWVINAIDLEAHDTTCPTRLAPSSFRFLYCLACARAVDTFGGNVD